MMTGRIGVSGIMLVTALALGTAALGAAALGTVASGTAQGAVAPVAPVAPARDALAARLVDERGALARALRQSRDAEARAARLGVEAAALTSASERDRAELAALALRIQAAEAQLAAGRARSAILAGQQRRQRQRLAAQQRPVAELVAALQLLTRRPPITLLAQPGTATDLVHMRATIEAMMPELTRRTSALRRELDRSRALIAARRSADARLAEAATSLAQRRNALARSEAQQRVRANGLASSAGLESDRALALGQDADDIGVLLDQLGQSSTLRDRLARLSGPQPRPGTVTSGGAGPLATLVNAVSRPAYRLPVVGRIVTGYGEVSGEGTRSRGLTIATAAGAQVAAPARGRIVYAGPFRSYGRIVIIDHGGGWTSLITDMVAVSVDVGQTVDQGFPIGRTGPDRPRLTIELRRAGQPIDIATLAM
jgi:murein hydrolase activator